MEAVQAYFLSWKPWVSVLILACGIVLWRKTSKFVKNKFLKKGEKSRKQGNIQLGLNAAKYLIAILMIVIILQINGVNVSSMATGLGIVGIVVGFALQDFLKDWIMGISIVWDGYFHVGDIVKYRDYVGPVRKFNFKSTKIWDVETGSLVTVSNRNISEIELISDWCDIDIPAPYEVEAVRMRAVCGKIADLCANLPEVRSCDFLGTQEFADSQILYRIRIHCTEDKKNETRRRALGIIQDVFAQEKIAIPYSQMDVHMK